MNSIIKLFCPSCIKWKKSELIKKDNFLFCLQDGCECIYEILDDIPILLTKTGDSCGMHQRKNLKRMPNSGSIY
jgi:hypothetical protein